MKYKLIIDENVEEEITVIAHKASGLTQQIEKLVQAFLSQDSIIGQKEDETRKLQFNEIECITIINRKIFAIDTNGDKYRIQHRLRELEEILPTNFIRINKSTLANEYYILQFNAAIGGGIDAIFHCGYKEYVSRRCFAEIRKRYEEK